MVVEFVLLHFSGRDLHAPLDLVFGVRRTTTQALLQLFQCAGHDKDSDDVALEQWVGQRGLAHLRGALHVDVEQEVGADREFVLHLAFERAVNVTVDVGVFVEMPFGDLLLEGGVVEEVVIDVVCFAYAWLAGGGGHDPPELGHFSEHTVAECGFATTCGARDNDEEAGLGNVVVHGV